MKFVAVAALLASTAYALPQRLAAGGVPFLGGINLAGLDFGMQIDGSLSGGQATDPPVSQIAHFGNQGANAFRVPFGWQFATGQPGGQLTDDFNTRLDAIVQPALSAGAFVVLDLHNYARFNGQIIGQGGPTNDQFADVWSQIATKFANQNNIIFGVMNEPHDIPDLSAWADSVQAAVNAIRAAGANSQLILIPGSSFSSAAALPTEAGPFLLKVTDPAGGTDKLIFDVHKYLDSDNSGTHADCVTDNVQVFQTLQTFLQQNGNRKAMLTESGGGEVADCNTDFFNELSFIKSNPADFVGFTAWAAGAFDTNYVLTLTPFANGTDQTLFTQAVLPNFP